MFKKLLFIITISISIFPFYLNAQIAFERHYGGFYSDYGGSVEQTSDGGYIICGSTMLSVDDRQGHGYIIKTDSLGDVSWTQTYGGDSLEWLQSLDLLADGYIFGGVSSSFSKSRKIWIIKTDLNGDTLWTKLYGPMSSQLEGVGVKQTLDGGYIVSGGYVSKYSPTMGVLLKLNADGDSLWAKIYEGGAIGCPYQVSDNNYAFVGTRVINDILYYWLGMTDAVGDTIWTRTYFTRGWAFSMEPTIDGGFILGGTTTVHDDTMPGACLLKTNEIGNSQWMKTYTVEITEPNFCVTQTNDDGYIFTTLNYDNADKHEDLILMKTNAEGNELWKRTFHGTGTTDERGSCVKQTQDGGYIVTGMTDRFTGNRDVYLIKTRPNGLVGIKEKPPSIRLNFRLAQNYPNPFNHFTQIRYTLPIATYTELTIYDIRGRQVRMLVKGERQRGIHSISWDCRDEQGKPIKSGIYFYHLKTPDGIKETRKMLLLE